MAKFVHNRLNGTPLADWAAGELRRNDPAALLRAGSALGNFDARSWLPSIDVPTAVVITELDEIVPPEHQRALATSIPGAERFGVPGSHTVCGTAPERFVPVLVAACRAVARRAAASEGALGATRGRAGSAAEPGPST
jgi:pimeloyl-ACP methyl ester carboxylesterase